MRKIMTFLLFCVVLVLAARIVVCMIQNQYVFYPERQLHMTPAESGMAFEDVYFSSLDGTRLHGWKIQGKPDQPWILFFHGNGGNISYCLEFVRSLYPLGYNWILFDYRGYGNSGGKPDEPGFYQDSLAAWEYCTKTLHVPTERLILWGFSLGGVAATYTGAKRHAAGMILEAPLQSAGSMVGKRPLLTVLYAFSSLSLDSTVWIRDCDMPKLMIHGTSDRTIPTDQSRVLLNFAREPVEMFWVKGADHNNIFLVGGESYREKVDRFISSATFHQRDIGASAVTSGSESSTN